MKERKRNDQRKDLQRVNIERLRGDTLRILERRSTWERSGRYSNAEVKAMLESSKDQFPYVQESSPMLYKLALEEEPAKVMTMLDLILGNIERARLEGLNGEQCSLKVDQDLTSLFYHPNVPREGPDE